MIGSARGRWAEALACEHLLRRGLVHLESNWRGPRGEIDIVMRDGPVLVFVEVRYRAGSAFGGGAESVDARKQGRLVDTAERYLQRTRTSPETPCRFDVVAVSGSTTAPRIEWIRDAFET